MSSEVIVNTEQIVNVISTTLSLIDKRLVRHGERVAYIADRIFAHSSITNLNYDKLMQLCAFHDIGAYKTEEIDNMLVFDNENLWSHSAYGYIFLREMTPLNEYAEAILYHHLPYNRYGTVDSKYLDYSAYIFLADRLDMLIMGRKEKTDISVLVDNNRGRFMPELLEALERAENEDHIVEAILDESYREEMRKIMERMKISRQESEEYLKMLVYSIDFRSEHTVTHTINTTAISMELARRYGLDDEEIKKIYYGALVHDLGKIAIPLDILEFPGKLTDEQMDVMRKHVSYTEDIVNGLINDEIMKIAVRHHEKLDGKGYPHGLTAKELSIPERIVAIADIVSALTSRRSYKDIFPKDKTISILTDMKERGQLDGDICDIAINQFDEIMEATDRSRDPVIHMYEQMYTSYTSLMNKYK